MEDSEIYQTYMECMIGIVNQVGAQEAAREAIAQKERDSTAEFENKYMQYAEELQRAKRTVQEQYASVWESCTRQMSLKRPRDQHPAATGLALKEAVRLQQQAASRIRDWFTVKAQRAAADRQRKAQAEAAKKAALDAAQAELARQKAEEAAREERERGEALIEAMKRKYRKNGQ